MVETENEDKSKELNGFVEGKKKKENSIKPNVSFYCGFTKSSIL